MSCICSNLLYIFTEEVFCLLFVKFANSRMAFMVTSHIFEFISFVGHWICGSFTNFDINLVGTRAWTVLVAKTRLSRARSETKLRGFSLVTQVVFVSAWSWNASFVTYSIQSSFHWILWKGFGYCSKVWIVGSSTWHFQFLLSIIKFSAHMESGSTTKGHGVNVVVSRTWTI